jgi:SAM-dependent methyltransferase
VRRSRETEILDGPGVPEHSIDRAYRDLTRIHRVLGDTAALIRALRRDPMPVRRILDVGCARGGVLAEIQRRLRVDAIGVDLCPPANPAVAFPILKADAVRDTLPTADVAFSMYLGHHLPDEELARLILNVGRFCRRFILMDLVRHPLPLALFRVFVAPFVSPIVVADGKVSIRRSYTPAELSGVAARALADSGATFHHVVSPLYARQVVDINYARA